MEWDGKGWGREWWDGIEGMRMGKDGMGKDGDGKGWGWESIWWDGVGFQLLISPHLHLVGTKDQLKVQPGVHTDVLREERKHHIVHPKEGDEEQCGAGVSLYVSSKRGGMIYDVCSGRWLGLQYRGVDMSGVPSVPG